MKFRISDKIFFWRERKKTSRKVLSLSILFCLLIGGIGALFTQSTLHTWYDGLVKSPFTPPNFVFALVWTILYTLMGISFWLIWEKVKFSELFPMLMFGVQFFFNLLWPILFFYLESPAAAFVDIILLFIAIVVTIESFRRYSRPAAALLLPYLLWICFAINLNLYIVMHN